MSQVQSTNMWDTKIIKNAIESFEFCDEIIVIDNNSTDKTAETSEKLGAKVYKKESRNFSVLRNFGKENAKGDFILYLDADEIISDELKKNIVEIAKQDKPAASYSITRKNYYLGKNEWPKKEKIKRLFLKEKLVGWKGTIHESPVVDGGVEELGGYILHFTHRNLSQMLKKTIEWSEEEAKLKLAARHPKMSLWRFFRVMATTFIDYYIKQKGYKLGTVGLIESIYQSFSTFITYARLWEMQKKVS